MPARKSTPGIMDELLEFNNSPITSKSVPAAIESNDGKSYDPEVETEQSMEDKKKTGTKKATSLNKSEETEKMRATFNLDSKTINDLENAWFELRKYFKPSEKGKVHKSLIIELALESVLTDLEKNGKNSFLVHKLKQIIKQ